MINRNNYEIWLIDYLDGNLSEKERLAVERFLELNVDIKDEFKGISNKLPFPQQLEFEHKESIKKVLEEVDFEEEFLIKFLEKDIPKEEVESAFEYIYLDKDRRRKFELYLKTKLEDEQDHYPDKQAISFANDSFREAISQKNYTAWIIAFYHDELNEEEKEKLRFFLNQKPDCFEDFKYFRHTLLPREVHVCQNKRGLKRYAVSTIIKIATQYAAIGLILLFATFMLNENENNPQYQDRLQGSIQEAVSSNSDYMDWLSPKEKAIENKIKSKKKSSFKRVNNINTENDFQKEEIFAVILPENNLNIDARSIHTLQVNKLEKLYLQKKRVLSIEEKERPYDEIVVNIANAMHFYEKITQTNISLERKLGADGDVKEWEIKADGRTLIKRTHNKS